MHSDSPRSIGGTKYVTGQVNYYDRRRGFGFISHSIFDAAEKREDLFVHATNLSPYYRDGQKYLCQGEYVEFRIEDGKRGPQAVDVTGINGGKLMMDFRRRNEDKNRSRGRRQPPLNGETSQVNDLSVGTE